MTSLVKLKRSLIDVAMGRQPADLVVQNGRWVCVQSGEIVPGTDVAMTDGHVAFVGADAQHCIGEGTRTIDAQGRYLVPGLLDAHMHVESGMVTITEFVRTVAPRGTTAIFIDPHEMANVFGLRGVELMLREAARQPIHVWVQMPSCVPSAPGLESPGASIGPNEVARAMHWPGIIGLGEVMDFPAVSRGDTRLLSEIALAEKAGRTVGGHYASTDLGRPFHAYVAGGAEDDHEGTRVEDAVARARQGMKPMLRYGAGSHDVASQAGALTEKRLDPRRFILCTDDSHAQTLVNEGHMDRVIRHAISEGIAPMAALQMATINPAEHFGLSREIGLIAPGRWADLVLVDDLTQFKPALVIAKGRIVAEAGKFNADLPRFNYPAWAKKSVHLNRAVEAADLVLKSPRQNARLNAHVIGVTENLLATRDLILDVHSENGDVKSDIARDIAKVAVIRRHRGMSGIAVGLTHGFGFTQRCAVASTVAHDCHHLIVVGTDEEQMALAANELARNGGGQVVVKDGRVVAMVELAIGGLMSTEGVEDVARKVAAVLAAFRACGCMLNNPNIQLSFLALPVIPDLRISDKGLVDVTKQELIPVLEEV